MALDNDKIIRGVKDRLYNSGLGEKPAIRQASGSSAVTGDLVDFTVADGTKFRAGHVLTSYGSSSVATAYGFYVLDIAANVLTCVNGYDGTAIADATAMPTLLEHNAPVTEASIWDAIDSIISTFLYPEIFDIVGDSVTPNFATLQSDADALDLKILRAWQDIGGESYQVAVSLTDNMPTALFASGKMLSYDMVIDDTLYYTAKRRVSLSTSTSGEGLEELIVRGVAAMAIEGTEASTNWETAKHDADDRGKGGAPSRQLWGAFYQAKQAYALRLAQEAVTQFRIDRG